GLSRARTEEPVWGRAGSGRSFGPPPHCRGGHAGRHAGCVWGGMAIIAMQSASTALNALNTSLDVTANNLANINTPGFKASRVNFQDLLYLERQQPGVENANGDQRPTGLYVGLGVKVSGTQQTFSQG